MIGTHCRGSFIIKECSSAKKTATGIKGNGPMVRDHRLGGYEQADQNSLERSGQQKSQVRDRGTPTLGAEALVVPLGARLQEEVEDGGAACTSREAHRSDKTLSKPIYKPCTNMLGSPDNRGKAVASALSFRGQESRWMFQQRLSGSDGAWIRE